MGQNEERNRSAVPPALIQVKLNRFPAAAGRFGPPQPLARSAASASARSRGEIATS
jgi:hypothetical protein